MSKKPRTKASQPRPAAPDLPGPAQRRYTCANCPGEITSADDLITVKIPDGGTGAAHRTCPTVGEPHPQAPGSTHEPQRGWHVVEARAPGIGATPIDLNPGDRIRLVFEGTVEDLEAGFIGPTPVVNCPTDTGLRLPHWLLRASRIERLAPNPVLDGITAHPDSPIDQALVEYVTTRGIPMPFYDSGSKISEEAEELRAAVIARDPQQVKEEVADVCFTAAVAARQFGFTPEEAMSAKIAKDRGRGPKVSAEGSD